MDEAPGFEPGLANPKPAALPLDDASMWMRERGSNPRPVVSETTALPAELPLNMEVGAGFEPTMLGLQSSALPLGYPTWGERRDLNPQPPGPQPGALPVELRPQEWTRLKRRPLFWAQRFGCSEGQISNSDVVDTGGVQQRGSGGEL